jgi:drug/metabolite transporter (DMT)-like permease
MNSTHSQKDTLIGIVLALIATILWAGNFIISRSVHTLIGPVSLAFFRWFLATIILLPIGWRAYKENWALIKTNFKYFFWVSLTGISLFNTFVYFAGHYTTAINMALIGTTSSPIFASLLALIFLKEKMGINRIIGMIICIIGILLLLSKGNWEKLMSFHFSTGDLWVLAGAFSFAIYNVLVRKKPKGLSSIHFLSIVFALGTLLLFPFFIAEFSFSAIPIQWNQELIISLLYLGFGTSVISFLCWNIALHKLGTGRTVLFGNLIPVFSTLEAVWLLHEQINWTHWVSGLLVVLGLILANMTNFQNTTTTNHIASNTISKAVE